MRHGASLHTPGAERLLSLDTQRHLPRTALGEESLALTLLGRSVGRWVVNGRPRGRAGWAVVPLVEEPSEG